MKQTKEEIESDLEIDGKHIWRMLVKDGRPVRLAISDRRVTNRHQDIEEYEVEVCELESPLRMQ